MNENLNLFEILKDCPRGTKLYSNIHGDVALYRVDYSREFLENGILYECLSNNEVVFISEDELYDKDKGEYILLPSKDQRDWGKFKVNKPKFDLKTLQPFDKILVRYGRKGKWVCGIFSHLSDYVNMVECVGGNYSCCIPYNDETKHLVGINEEAPEYYKYWED